MKPEAPYQSADLAELHDRLYRKATAVVAGEDVFEGRSEGDVILMRHDVDWDAEVAVKMAEWEAERGYRSSYHWLHSAPYWTNEKLLRASCERVAELGHEIAFHTDALAQAVLHGGDPAEIELREVTRLRSFGFKIRSTVAHGNQICRALTFANDEIYAECRRPAYGAPNRVLEWEGRRLKIQPRPLADFGYEFDPGWLPRGGALSDSGGRWNPAPFDEVMGGFPRADGQQLHVLIHPVWWREAFA